MLSQAGERKPAVLSISLSIFNLCTTPTHTIIPGFFAPETLLLTPLTRKGQEDTATASPDQKAPASDLQGTAQVLTC